MVQTPGIFTVFFLAYFPVYSYFSLSIPRPWCKGPKTVALFVGEFEQTVDAKHRLAINAALREQIVPEEDGKNFILTMGPDRHLWLYPDLYYRRLVASLKRSPFPDRQSRKIDLLFAMARLLKPDSQGRVVLPEKSMQRGVVGEQVTLVGQFDHIEIWPSEEWEKHVAETLPGYGEALYEAGDRLKSEQGDQKEP
jgi:MraZ protein